MSLAAYAHPLFMAATLALGVWVLREGLRIRRGRVRRVPVDNKRHRRWARVFVIAVALGYPAGLASQAWIRGKPVFESVHALLASGALLGVLAGGLLGRRLEGRGAGLRIRNAHAVLAAGGLLLGLAAAAAGLAILP